MQPLLTSFENTCPGQANGLPSLYLVQAIQMILSSHCLLGDPNDYSKDFGNRLQDGDAFDFIVIGGGSICDRLSYRNGCECRKLDVI